MSSSAAKTLDDAADAILGYSSTIDSFASQYFVHQRSRLIEDLEMIQRVSTPGSTQILEIGSSPLFATKALQLLGYSVIGLDIDPERFADAISSEGLDVRTVDIEAQPFPLANESVDLVVMNEVFEHLRSPLPPIEEIERVLVPGGTLLLSTPNLRSFRGIGNLVIRGKGWAVGADPSVEHRKPRTIGHMGHVREYTAIEVRDLLASCGLICDKVIHRGSLGPAPERLLYRAVPIARPFMTIVARKPTS